MPTAQLVCPKHGVRPGRIASVDRKSPQKEPERPVNTGPRHSIKQNRPHTNLHKATKHASLHAISISFRTEEYILFLYLHRYHDHSRGSWTAGEVTGINGDGALFCIPAQQTIPLLVRWMLVFEDSDDEHLHFGRALPREWIGTGKPIGIVGAPTRWGRVDYRLETRGRDTLTATITLPPKGDLPKELHVTFRAAKDRTLRGATVNGKPAKFEGPHQDAVIIYPKGERTFEVIAQLA